MKSKYNNLASWQYTVCVYMKKIIRAQRHKDEGKRIVIPCTQKARFPNEWHLN